MYPRRTDLALEAREIYSEREGGGLPGGIEEETRQEGGFTVTKVKVTNENGEEVLCKPKGSYITIELGRFLRREDGAFSDGAAAVAKELGELIPKDGPVLVAGLGNPAITPDAVGHLTVKNLLVTRHLTESNPESFAYFRSVCAVEPGVLGTTGVESGEVIKAVAEKVRPVAVIAVDALASRRTARLCSTVQIADTGIVPGSGVGNARAALNRETLGVPVIAVGVPTVVDAATLAADMAEKVGEELDEERLRAGAGGMIVTPREIDTRVREVSRLIGYGINLALHRGITVGDIDMFLG